MLDRGYSDKEVCERRRGAKHSLYKWLKARPETKREEELLEATREVFKLHN